MDQPSKQAELHKHSDLWESGKWAMHMARHTRQRVYFVFPAGRPTVTELVAVRSLLPRFANAPVTELKTEVGNLAEFFVGDFSSMEGFRFMGQAHARGLHTRYEGRSYTNYLPVALDGSGSALIEDDELMQLIAAEMLRHDVPIQISEVD